MLRFSIPIPFEWMDIARMVETPKEEYIYVGEGIS